MELSGQQIGELKEALLKAFTVDTFQMMLKERLDKELFRFASPNANFSKILFDTIDAANREGWIDDLITRAREVNPKNSKLYSFAQAIGLTSTTTQQFQQLERLVRASNQFLDSNQWLTSLSRIENQVCRIEIETDQGKTLYGTGFLISSNTLITNYHVMEAVILGEAGQTTEDGFSAKSSNVKCRFDYKRLGNKVLNPGTVYQLDSNWQIDISPNSPLDKLSLTQTECLDYAIIRLEGEPGNEFVASKNASSGESRGWIKLPENIANDDFLPNSPLFIMQHPQGQPLKLALDTNAIIGLTDDKTRLRYRTNTEPGSSGSPCFNQKLELIALHHSGDPNFDYDYKPTYNEGIPFSAITALLKKRNISFDGGDVKTTNSDSNKAQNNSTASQQPSKETIKPTTTQATEAKQANNFTPNNSTTLHNSNNITIVNQQILSFRPGAIKTTIVAFIIINGVKDIGGVEAAELLTKLHSSIKSLINKQASLNVQVLSNLLGAIILFPNSAQFNPLDSIKLIIELNNEMTSNGISIKVGMSLGDVQELIDIDGKANFIGVCINQAARLATAKMDNHPGLLVHESLANHLQATLRASHWLSGKNSNRLSIEILGKRDEKFLCYYPPTNIWPSLPNITYSYDESFHPESKNAALIAYDLPNFSDGDLNQLSQRFRAISDVFLALVAETKLPLKYFYFSPGGDGGVMVFTDLEKKPVYDLAKNFAEKLLIESQNKSSLISSECRIGLHYGTILLYENAQGDLRPTGDDIFIADAITGDDAAKQADKLIFTETFTGAASGGDNNYFNQYFQQIPDFHFATKTIKRYTYRQLPYLPSIKLEVHKAYFKASPILYYFLCITNLSNHPITITHLWYEDTNNHIPVNPQSRPLPKTLTPTEVWASWVPVASIPSLSTNDAYNLFNVRLSDGQKFSSCQNTTIPPAGSVPGGAILASDIKSHTNSNIMDKAQELAINYIKTLEEDLEAAYRDLDSSVSEVNRERIKRKIKSLADEIKHSKDNLS